MTQYKNIVFDLGGVVVARDPRKVSAEFQEFFSFIYQIPMPHFWRAKVLQRGKSHTFWGTALKKQRRPQRSSVKNLFERQSKY